MEKVQRLSILSNVYDGQISLGFYHRLLGLNGTESGEDEGRVPCSLECGCVTRMLNEYRGSASPRRGGLCHPDCYLYLSFANLAEIRSMLRAEGFDVIEPESQAYGPLPCSAAHPDGNVVALSQSTTGFTE